MDAELPLEYVMRRELTAADCNAQFELPLPALVQMLVEAATDHANRIGVGYDRLAADGHAWVLMRLTLGIGRMPRVGETFEIATWVDSFTRRFSTRDFALSVDGEQICRARSVWGVINSKDRTPATLEGLEVLESLARPVPESPTACRRVRPADFAEPTATTAYRVVVSDIDTNRHLTSARYISLMLDMWTLDDFDRRRITQFEVSFGREARYGDDLTVERRDFDADTSVCRLVMASDKSPLATASIAFRERS